MSEVQEENCASTECPGSFVKRWSGGGSSEYCWLILRKDSESGLRLTVAITKKPMFTETLLGSPEFAEKWLALLVSLLLPFLINTQ